MAIRPAPHFVVSQFNVVFAYFQQATGNIQSTCDIVCTMPIMTNIPRHFICFHLRRFYLCSKRHCTALRDTLTVFQFSLLSFLASTFLLYSSGLSRLISTSEVLYCTVYNVILIFHSIYDVSYSCRVRNVIFFLLWLQGNFCFVFSATDWWTGVCLYGVHARVVCNSVYFSDLDVSDVCYNLCCPSSIVISTLLATYCLADCYYISTGPMWAPVL